MTVTADPNYDPGFVNAPGKGQSPENPLGSVFIQSLGVVTDLSVYQDIFSGNTVNAANGYTLGLNNFFSKDLFLVSTPGTFTEDIAFSKNVVVGGNVFIQGFLSVNEGVVINGNTFKPTTISTENGSYLVLAAN